MYINSTIVEAANGARHSYLTLEEVAYTMNITRERVRQIQEKALGRVFKKMQALNPDLDAFDVMASIAAGFKIQGPNMYLTFYSAFPSKVKKLVKKSAYKHAPYITRIENERFILKNTIDNLAEAV